MLVVPGRGEVANERREMRDLEEDASDFRSRDETGQAMDEQKCGS